MYRAGWPPRKNALKDGGPIARPTKKAFLPSGRTGGLHKSLLYCRAGGQGRIKSILPRQPSGIRDLRAFRAAIQSGSSDRRSLISPISRTRNKKLETICRCWFNSAETERVFKGHRDRG